jgi:hypothetical protein
MNLEIWLPAIFLLRITGTVRCDAFMIVCEKIQVH